jgi:hypothetical protein
MYLRASLAGHDDTRGDISIVRSYECSISKRGYTEITKRLLIAAIRLIFWNSPAHLADAEPVLRFANVVQEFGTIVFREILFQCAISDRPCDKGFARDRIFLPPFFPSPLPVRPLCRPRFEKHGVNTSWLHAKLANDVLFSYFACREASRLKDGAALKNTGHLFCLRVFS